jgi:16S rRNA (guanine966-N2)-methyltransferase
VIAGRFGGRRLQAPAGRATRPTSDRVREALFSMLGSLDGLEVLDLFAGTGALAIEALSRGAVRAVAIEHDRAAVAALEANMRALQLAPGELELRRVQARVALRAARERGETYDLILIDPPYAHARAWGPELSAALPPLLKPATRVVVESDRRAPLELTIELERERIYGDTSIRIHRNKCLQTSS